MIVKIVHTEIKMSITRTANNRSFLLGVFMKQYFNKILSFVLAISVSITTFLCFPISAFATHGGSGGVNHDKDAWIMKDTNTINVEDDGKVMYYIEYLLSQAGAFVYDHDITKLMSNDQTMKSYIAKGYYDSNEDKVVFPQETVTYVYNTFQTKMHETTPYYIAFSYPVNRLNYAAFNNQKNVYDTVNNLLADSKSGVIKIALRNTYFNNVPLTYIWFAEFEDFTDVGFVKPSDGSVNKGNAYRYSTWNFSKETIYQISLTPDDSAIETISEFKEKATATKTYQDSSPINLWQIKLCDETMAQTNGATALWGGNSINAWLHLVTSTRRSFRVFNSFDELANYSLGNRKVYYTSEYYDYVPADVTVSLDDMVDTVDQLDDVLNKLLDKIDDKTDESKIEELLGQILDEMKNQGGGGGGNESGGSYDDTGLLNILSGYFSSVLSYLEGIASGITEGFATLADQLDAVIVELGLIYESVEDMTEDEVSEKTDSLLSSLMAAFSEIGALLKTKFPFSVPWDFYTFLSLMGGKEIQVESDTGTVMLSAYGFPDDGIMPLVGEPDDGEYDYPNGDGTSTTVVWDNNPYDAPVFEIPLVIASAGIDSGIKIDLAPFDPVSKISRAMLTILYCIGLLNLTFKIISLGKELSDD